VAHFARHEPHSATDEYLATVTRSAAACSHEMTADDWVMVWQHRHQTNACEILSKLGIISIPPPD
jgi:hypothetical protein